MIFLRLGNDGPTSQARRAKALFRARAARTLKRKQLAAQPSAQSALAQFAIGARRTFRSGARYRPSRAVLAEQLKTSFPPSTSVTREYFLFFLRERDCDCFRGSALKK